MSSALAIDAAEVPDSVVDDGEFELDMHVVESTTRIAVMMCDTSDGCGNTCSTSACSTGSNNPF